MHFRNIISFFYQKSLKEVIVSFVSPNFILVIVKLFTHIKNNSNHDLWIFQAKASIIQKQIQRKRFIYPIFYDKTFHSPAHIFGVYFFKLPHFSFYLIEVKKFFDFLTTSHFFLEFLICWEFFYRISSFFNKNLILKLSYFFHFNLVESFFPSKNILL